MARSRNIKPGIMTNELLGELEPIERLLFVYLWMLADRDGRLEDRPKRIKAEALPYDNIDADKALDRLSAKGFIRRYVAEGQKVIQVVKFAEHQAPHVREKGSALPEQSLECAEIEPSPEEEVTEHNLGSAKASPRSPDSLIPDSLIPDSLQTPCAPSVRDEGPSSDELFAKFYKLYPNKKGKANAVKAWKKLKLTDDLINQIFDGLARYCVSADWLKDGGQFVPHPASWLNGKRWEDEVKPAGNVHQFPGKSRHTGFEERDYSEGLTLREDGSYVL